MTKITELDGKLDFIISYDEAMIFDLVRAWENLLKLKVSGKDFKFARKCLGCNKATAFDAFLCSVDYIHEEYHDFLSGLEKSGCIIRSDRSSLDMKYWDWLVRSLKKSILEHAKKL